ncbi:hypothetical protein, partial [Bisbaumannia pacifica]
TLVAAGLIEAGHGLEEILDFRGIEDLYGHGLASLFVIVPLVRGTALTEPGEVPEKLHFSSILAHYSAPSQYPLVAQSYP